MLGTERCAQHAIQEVEYRSFIEVGFARVLFLMPGPAVGLVQDSDQIGADCIGTRDFGAPPRFYRVDAEENYDIDLVAKSLFQKISG